MEEYFITQIDINKVRHLENLQIKLSETERKHLILTGKNGSGKTSVIQIVTSLLKNIMQRKALLTNNTFSLWDGKNATFSSVYELGQQFSRNNFIIVSFDATTRTQKPEIPNSATKSKILDFEIDKKNNNIIIQYLVNLHFKKLNAANENDQETLQKIDNWFEKFTTILRDIFQDNTLILKFDIDNMNFNIITKGRKPFDFTTLSDGYAAFLNIVTELILRMESKAPAVYDVQGIVLIDEIETHLHIDLQKKIMPMLTTFFPKIQFIVTTHSPFVLSSISNAVIYDLEKNLRVEDLSSYAVDGIIEGYFDVDKYSQEIKEKFTTYQQLFHKEQLNEDERELFVDLRNELKDISVNFAPELAYEFKTLELSRVKSK